MQLIVDLKLILSYLSYHVILRGVSWQAYLHTRIIFDKVVSYFNVWKEQIKMLYDDVIFYWMLQLFHIWIY